jgi:hypothetical protein
MMMPQVQIFPSPSAQLAFYQRFKTLIKAMQAAGYFAAEKASNALGSGGAATPCLKHICFPAASSPSGHHMQSSGAHDL